MKTKHMFITFASATVLSASALLVAAEMDHSKMDHSKMQMKAPLVKPGGLQKLDKLPASGKSREAGFDENYAMESTTVENDLATRCAQASRGLVMLDNATWQKCGGKPAGAAKGAGYYPAMPPWNKEGTGKAAPMDHSRH